jgi:hypothetical protein
MMHPSSITAERAQALLAKWHKDTKDLMAAAKRARKCGLPVGEILSEASGILHCVRDLRAILEGEEPS